MSTNNKTIKEKQRKRKRTSITDALPTTTATKSKVSNCTKCGLILASRNQLFRHLRTSKACSENSYQDTTAALVSTTTRAVLIVAYLGRRYFGSARNDPTDSVPTVEGCLWKAIAQALLEQHDSDSFSSRIQEKTNPVAMTRSSRTDKGVSALGNVYSLLLPDHGAAKDKGFVSSVNRCLPEDIRLVRIIHPIPLSFDARTCCEARRYRYFVPVQVLFRKKKKNEEEESVLDLRKRLKRVLLQWGGTHSFHNFTNWNNNISKLSQTRSKSVSKATNDEESFFRHILRCHVEDVIQHNQMSFVIISTKGQSFVYHQIRKMMGATIGVMNQSLPEDFISQAFKEEETDIDVPLAPAEGLVMVEAMYSKYCSKHNVEPIGLGTKLLYRDSDAKSTSREGGLTGAWEANRAKLQQETDAFQRRVYEQICKDQKLMFKL